jgi:predicted dehydrogenase
MIASDMKTLTRRSFLKTAAVAGAGAAASAVPTSTRAAPVGANGAIRIAIIGLGTKGRAHLKQLAGREDTRVVALCDVDEAVMARAVKEAETSLAAPFTCTDARQIMARQDVDVIVIASGNHWHALQAVWGCQAGKDVYVEKPMTHTVWEGRQLIAAAAKYGRIVQAGTQYRSERGLAEGIEYVRSNALGRLTHVHAVYYGGRGAIKRREPWYPDFLDYNLFCGPTPMIPLEREKLHYDWHWSWATGNGELGNNGVHLLDVALRFIGADTAPRRILGLGGRFVHKDAADTPNTQIAVYDYPKVPVIYEGRALSAKPGMAMMDQVNGVRVGVVAHCEGGYVSGLAGCAAHDPSGKVIKKFAGDGGRGHMDNFLQAVRSRRAADLAAPATVGHVSAALCHYGNISLRVGEATEPAAIARELESIPAAAGMSRSMQEHLQVHGIDLAQQRLTLGPWLELDPAADAITQVSSRDDAALARARYLLHEAQRPPFVIPEKV